MIVRISILLFLFLFKLPYTGQTKLLLLTYQRGGSSFLGELFNNNPESLYVFEPLDSLYASLYGVSQGWSIRDDITNNGNGIARWVHINFSLSLFQYVYYTNTHTYIHTPTYTRIYKTYG